MSTSIGRFNQRVRIESPVSVADGQGGQSVTWALRGVVWALVEPITGREALMAQQLVAVLSTGVTIRFRPDLSIKDRILVGNRVLQVESYQDPDGGRVELRVLCSEVQT